MINNIFLFETIIKKQHINENKIKKAIKLYIKKLLNFPEINFLFIIFLKKNVAQREQIGEVAV
jgi:hypothetical protein